MSISGEFGVIICDVCVWGDSGAALRWGYMAIASGLHDTVVVVSSMPLFLFVFYVYFQVIAV